mmetsp:Transcript_6757/g.20033  ORF Transcript_6757/g.20033 Transcript_6757/m.20033 type:complete len:250 (-) Transcript_6757:1473-2222(-)
MLFVPRAPHHWWAKLGEWGCVTGFSRNLLLPQPHTVLHAGCSSSLSQSFGSCIPNHSLMAVMSLSFRSSSASSSPSSNPSSFALLSSSSFLAPRYPSTNFPKKPGSFLSSSSSFSPAAEGAEGSAKRSSAAEPAGASLFPRGSAYIPTLGADGDAVAAAAATLSVPSAAVPPSPPPFEADLPPAAGTLPPRPPDALPPLILSSAALSIASRASLLAASAASLFFLATLIPSLTLSSVMMRVLLGIVKAR